MRKDKHAALRMTTNEPRVIGLRLSYRFGKAAVE